MHLRQGTDILKEWKPGQHVYVKGRLGVSDARLAELETWIGANHANWTVLLMQTAGGESYRDVNGRSYRSIDAVEHAMGKGLPATTGFGSLKHPETGQANGAFFILFLEERKFSYYGSEAYDRRGLGARQWAGKLDASAKRAMRNGGRIVEAAKGTIADIDQRLANALVQEQRRAEEARQSAERREEEARLSAARRKVAAGQLVTSGNQELAALDTLLAEFRNDRQVAGGDLANPRTATWRADLQGARDAWEAGQINIAETVTTAARTAIAAATKAIRQHETDEARIRSMTGQIDGFTVHPFNHTGEAVLADLKERLESVRKEHAAGNSSYRNGLVQLQGRWEELQQANLTAERTQRREAAWLARRREVRRNTIIGTCGGTGGLILLAGIIGNRLRRRRKLEAEALLARRQQELRDVSDRLLALLDRSSLVLGSEVDLPNRGYEGETLAEAKRGIAAVDEAFVISSHVRDLIRRGEDLISPRNPLSGIRNLVSSGRYRRAIDLLDDEVVCRPASPPPLPGTAGQPGPARPGRADGEDFALELPEWTGHLENTMRNGSNAIDTVDTAWATIADRQDALRRAIGIIKSLERDVSTPASDGWLGLSNLFNSWLPHMEDLLEQAVDTGRADPVAALRGPVTTGDRMAAEARTLTELVLDLRNTRWQEIEEQEARLAGRERATVWLDQRLDSLSAAAESIASDGRNTPVGDRIDDFGRDLRSLADQVAAAAREAERADTSSLKDLDAAAAEVAAARDDLGRKLTVPPDTVLVETPERNPSLLLGEGRAQRQAALASLDVGAADTAREFLDEVDRLVAEARALVQSTREAYQNYERERRALIGARDAWKQHVDRTRGLVTTLRADYAPAALLVDVDSGDGPSIADASLLLDKGLATVTGLLEQAADAHAAARLLKSREMLDAGMREVAEGGELCTEVEARRDSLVELAADNAARLQATIRISEDLEPMLEDRRVMRPTVQLFAEASSRLEEARGAVRAAGHLNNPYETADLLEELDERLTVIRGEITNDLQLHQDATELLAHVRLAEREARTLAGRAHDDGIPDSPQTTRDLTDVNHISRSLSGVETAMQEDHGDWRKTVDELASIHASLRKVAMTLRSELRLAQEAVATIKQAEESVHRAGRWSGPYGVTITGSPGSHAIVDANRAIMAGDYHGCMRHAGFALTQARQAIARAEAEVAAVRRRREAAAAARRAAVRRSRMSSSSGFGSFGSSRSSSFGSSSSVGRSSFSSSSGVGRSGW